MLVDPSSGVIAHAIQLAIAPVFLLTGIAGLLGVMSTRLARVIDRARSIETTWSGMDADARTAARRASPRPSAECGRATSASLPC